MILRRRAARRKIHADEWRASRFQRRASDLGAATFNLHDWTTAAAGAHHFDCNKLDVRELPLAKSGKQDICFPLAGIASAHLPSPHSARIALPDNQMGARDMPQEFKIEPCACFS
jgi:hypothetical protein